jgi:hypothetical protein
MGYWVPGLSSCDPDPKTAKPPPPCSHVRHQKPRLRPGRRARGGAAAGGMPAAAALGSAAGGACCGGRCGRGACCARCAVRLLCGWGSTSTGRGRLGGNLLGRGARGTVRTARGTGVQVYSNILTPDAPSVAHAGAERCAGVVPARRAAPAALHRWGAVLTLYLYHPCSLPLTVVDCVVIG